MLLDIVMPGIDGFTVCKILQENPLTCEIPIIFITAKTEKEDIVKDLECRLKVKKGSNFYFTFPIC
ncbi:MAG: response regulator [Candidatus Marithrix sp.]